MAEQGGWQDCGDDARAREIRFTVSGTLDRGRDLDDIARWLRDEGWFDSGSMHFRHSAADGTDHTPAPDGGRPTMDAGILELVLVITGWVAQPISQDIYDKVSSSLAAWLDNRRVLRMPDENPDATIEEDPGVGPGTDGPGTIPGEV